MIRNDSSDLEGSQSNLTAPIATIICVIAPGVPHAVPRTIAFSKYVRKVHFIDMQGNADQAALESNGISYHRISDSRHSGLESLKLYKLIAEIAPDSIIVHFCSGPHFFSAVAYGRCPVGGIVMGSDVLYELGDKSISQLHKLLIRLGIKSLHYISAKSSFLMEKCRSYGVNNDISVNYWGADLQLFAPQELTKARESLELPINRPIILSPRTLSPLYNIDIVITAMAEVVKLFPEVLLVILGKEVPEYKKRLIQLIDSYQLNDNIRIIGPVNFNIISTWYAAADLVVSMASTEGFPNTVLEVMSSRRPIIAGQIPQIEEILINDLNSRIVKIESKSLSSCLIDLLRNPEKASAIAAAGYITAIEIADLRKNAHTFITEFNEAIKDHKKPSFIKLLIYRLLFAGYAVQRKLSRSNKR